MNSHTNQNAISQEKQRKAEREKKIQERMALHDATDEAENSDSWSDDSSDDCELEAWYSSFSWRNDEWDDISDSSDYCDRFIYADSTEDEYSAEDTYWSQVDNPEFQDEDWVSGDDQYTEDWFPSSGRYGDTLDNEDEGYHYPNYSMDFPDADEDDNRDAGSEEWSEFDVPRYIFWDDDEMSDDLVFNNTGHD